MEARIKEAEAREQAAYEKQNEAEKALEELRAKLAEAEFAQQEAQEKVSELEGKNANLHLENEKIQQ